MLSVKRPVMHSMHLNPCLFSSKKQVRFGENEPQSRPAAPVKAEPPKLDPYTQYVPGLEGIIAGTTKVGRIDPKLCSLVYRGYEIRELVEHSNFEEVTHLLLNGELPSNAQARDFNRKLRTQRGLPKEVLQTLKKMPKDANQMAVLRTAVSQLALHDPQASDNSHEANVEKAIRLTAKMPTIIAASYRYSQGLKPIKPDPKLSQAENFLYMLSGEKPDPMIADMFDKTLIIYAEHNFNASTFAARVTASTESDLHSAVVSGIGALKGPLHGGANEAAMKVLEEIGTPENVVAWLTKTINNGGKVAGFGHRIYKNGDPRAMIGKEMGKQLAQYLGAGEHHKWIEMADIMEDHLVNGKIRADKKLYPNVDFPISYVYKMMGIPTEAYVPIFAMARVTGWSAHVIEQLDKNRILRPESIYEGHEYREYPDKKTLKIEA